MAIKTEAYQFLKEWAKRKSGILLDGKEVMVESRLVSLAMDAKKEGVEGLVAAIRAEPDAPLAVKVLEALTTNETFWFRDHHPFEILRTLVIPECLEVRKTAKTFRLWCAACSMGQEPYSIAMLMKHYFPQMDAWKIQILATDLSQKMVDKAAAGLFDHQELNRGLPALYLARYFEEVGDNVRVIQEIRKRIEFKTLNLTQAFAIPNDLDVIFIRNVLIYFDAPMKRAILLRAIQNLRPGGALFLGAAESLYGLDIPLVTVMAENTMYYRKPV